jgi:hypothetical protein
MSLVSGETYKNFCKFSLCSRYPIYLNFNLLEEGDFIFLNLDYFDTFLSLLNKNIKKFNLITQNSDKTFDQKCYDSIKDYIINVFPINCDLDITNTKIIIIPIGFPDTKYKPHDFMMSIATLKLDKNILCYLNFNVKTNIEERQVCLDILTNKTFITKEFDVPYQDFYKKLKMSKYVISPKGTGIDCHRIYESILYDAIPIIKKNELNDFYETLPVFIVDSWDDITEELLLNKYNDLHYRLQKWKEYNPDWLNAKYWINRYSNKVCNLICHHQGFGDYFNTAGLVKFYASILPTVYLLVRDDAKELINVLYYEKNIKIILLNKILIDLKLEDIVNSLNTTFVNINRLFIGFKDELRDDKFKKAFVTNIELPKKPNNGGDIFFFYDTYNINFDVRYKYFNIKRNLKSELKLYEKYINNNEEYIIYHEDKERNLLIDHNILPSNIKKININQICENFFDALTLLEKSKEIHIFDSSYSVLIYLMQHKYNMFKQKICIHSYNRRKLYNDIYTNPENNWTWL